MIDTRNAARAACIVIGGGPAGLFAAIRYASALVDEFGSGALADKPVLVLEKGQRPGRKLLVTGSGQCNITHSGEVEDFLERYGDKGRFLKGALYAFPPPELLAWFEARGLEFETEDGGKVFPASRRADQVLGALLGEAERLGVRILNAHPVSALERAPDTFAVACPAAPGGPERIYVSPCVILATGGRSWPRTGSEGDGYALAASLGHAIVPPRPALAAVRVLDFPLRELSGLSFPNLRYVIRRDGKKHFEARGDVLLTHEGLSGPGILDSSRDLRPGDILELEFAKMGPEEYRTKLSTELKKNPKALARSALIATGIPRRMAELFCDSGAFEPWTTGADLSREGREALVRLACAYPVEIHSLGAWDEAMTTAGGIDTDEVSRKTMESRLSAGLYFAGEVLDVDGDSGGFNLQAAFSTGALAGSSAYVRTKTMTEMSSAILDGSTQA